MRIYLSMGDAEVKKIFFKFIYITIASKLPLSNSKLGKILLAKWIRNFLARKICNKIDKTSNIEKGAIFTDGLELGYKSGIGKNCKIADGVVIGNFVLMGPNVVIHTTNHEYLNKNEKIMEQGYRKAKQVFIYDDVWIGENVIILPGVNIGQGAVIGAGSVVTKNVEEYSVVAGNPAKVIKYRV